MTGGLLVAGEHGSPAEDDADAFEVDEARQNGVDVERRRRQTSHVAHRRLLQLPAHQASALQVRCVAAAAWLDDGPWDLEVLVLSFKILFGRKV